MNWADPLFICSAGTGIILLILALIMHQYPPKEINDFYGYRSTRAKASQEAWDFSQIYSANLMMWIALYNLTLSLLGLFISFTVLWAMIIFMGFLIVSFIYFFKKVEEELKQRFDE